MEMVKILPASMLISDLTGKLQIRIVALFFFKLRPRLHRCVCVLASYRLFYTAISSKD